MADTTKKKTKKPAKSLPSNGQQNPRLETLLNLINASDQWNADEKNSAVQAVRDTEKELAEKNREIEVEAALEKVREKALAMNDTSDMPDVCRTISDQLENLNVKNIRNVQTAIINQSKGTYFNYEYYSRHHKIIITEVDYSHPMSKSFINQMLRGPGEFFSRTLEGKELKDWYAYQKTTNQFADQYLESAESLTYYWYSLGPVALGISTYSPLSDEEMDLFKRFRNVFELAYRRFMDIETAIGQVREAQIEAALERVRSSALAMLKSKDVNDAVVVMFETLEKLEPGMVRCGVGILHKKIRTADVWATSAGEHGKVLKVTGDESVDIHPLLEGAYNAWLNQKDFSYELKGEDLIQYYSALTKTNFRLPEAQSMVEKARAQPDSQPLQQFYYVAPFEAGNLFAFRETPFPDEAKRVMRRFASAFNLTYKRFLDLQKAEAQFRESQIEASLERVRSRAMAMHESSHLTEAAGSLFTELNKLGINPIRSGFVLLTKESRRAKLYPATSLDKKNTVSFTGEFEFVGHPVFEKQYESWQKGEDYFPVLEGAVMKSYYRILSEAVSIPYENFPTDKKQYGCFLPFTEGFLFTWSEEPYSAEEINILNRFKSILDLTIRRYLDLMKAEAQARESQIQLALERVRARTMAMQKSAELSETVYVLFQQFKELGEKPDQATIGVVNEDEGVIEYWVTMYGDQTNRVFKFSIDEPHVTNKIYRAWKEGKKSLVIDLGGKELREFADYRESMGGAKYNPDEKRRVINVGFFSKGLLNVQSTEERSDESIKLLERFAAVFDQTYTRFLDLKKAEAQAREAQIEVALERVRAVTMSMMKSEELLKVCEAVFTQLRTLGFSELRNAQIYIAYDEQGKFLNYFYSDYLGSEIVDVEYGSHPKVRAFTNAIRTPGETLTKYDISGDELEDWKNYLYNTLGQKHDRKLDHATELHYYFYSLGTGTLGVSSFKILDDEELKILKKFCNVFNLSYQRYADIAQAEAQAREALIQTSLERVRASAMAMHKSEDLTDVCEMMYKEFGSLGFNEIRNAIININSDTDHSFINYDYAAEVGKSVHRFTNDVLPFVDKIIKSSQSANDAFSESHITGKALEEFKKLRSVTGQKEDPRLNSATGLYFYFYSIGIGSIGISTFAEITEEKKALLKRFRNVFDLAYKRYVDITHAEAQAREAQIEAALERVRSRSMGMQKSEELKEVIQVVYEQLIHINIHAEHAGFVVDYQPKGDWHFWIADERNVPSKITHPWFDSVWANQFDEAKEHGIDFFITTLNFEEKNKFYQELFSYVPDASDEARTFYFNCPGLAATTVLMENVSLYIENFSGTPYSDEENAVLMRFGKVFQQTYTRFLDLQKAEAQTHEAQVEAGLERVRSRTLAMHSSDELAETAAVLFKQLILLGIEPNRLYIAIVKDETGNAEFWITDEDGSKVSSGFAANLNDNPTFQKMFLGWNEKKHSLTIDMEGNELKEYFQYLIKINVPFKGGLEQRRRVQTIAYFSQGFIGIASPDTQPEDTTQLLERFASVFNLTYTRFNDLKVAEAQTRKAQIETALEKVRARALAMQEPEELKEVAWVLRNEMGLLGVEELETCSIYIRQDNSDHAECWFAIKKQEDEKKMLSDYFTLNFNDTWVGREMLKFYNSDAMQTSIVMKGAARREWIEYCYKNSSAFSGFYGDTIPDRTYHLYKFSNGAIGAAAPGDISAESWDLLARTSSVFSLAYSRFKDLTKARIDLQNLKEEKKRSESLLLNILPEEIAAELKQFGKSYARKYDQVTILFADIKGFSTIAENLSAQELVTQLDECFRAFDHIVDKHGLEKIKTVGDAYVCACGLPKPVPDNAIKTVRAAIDMMNFIKGFAITKTIQDLPAFEFRIGIHTGPVVTGVVGLKKFTYDIWGDAVNMAARMEQHGEAGKINISESTYDLVKDKFSCTSRGKISAKNKGEVEMYFVEG